VEKQGFKFNRNIYNLQGSLRNEHIADSASGEIILYRILKHHMTDFEFYNECIELGAKKIYEIIKSLSE
jgi:nickel-dependent lactate racemase